MNATLSTIRRLIRPPFAALLALDAAIGMAQSGHLPSTATQLVVFVAIGAWMLFAVAVNDLADVAIDQVNLPDDGARVLVTGEATRQTVVGIAGISALVAVVAAGVLGPVSAAVIVGGLALAAAYSLPPIRLSGRGALTSALLPLGYVTVPYFVGALAAGASRFHPVLLVGLYLGFMGRLVLKDFRDERGDRLYDKRTFLVRHGRDRTLMFSAVFWSAGAVVALGGVPRRLGTLVAVLAFMLVVLADIARDDDGARDLANISAIAILGRALLSTVLVQLVMNGGGRSLLQQNLITVGLAVCALGTAWECRRAMLASAGVQVPNPTSRMASAVTAARCVRRARSSSVAS